jgi:hypothetical protein
MKRKSKIKVCRLLVIGPKRDFYIYFYGLSASDLCTIPNEYITQMQQRTGFTRVNGYNSSPFFLEDVR